MSRRQRDAPPRPAAKDGPRASRRVPPANGGREGRRAPTLKTFRLNLHFLRRALFLLFLTDVLSAALLLGYVTFRAERDAAALLQRWSSLVGVASSAGGAPPVDGFAPVSDASSAGGAPPVDGFAPVSDASSVGDAPSVDGFGQIGGASSVSGAPPVDGFAQIGGASSVGDASSADKRLPAQAQGYTLTALAEPVLRGLRLPSFAQEWLPFAQPDTRRRLIFSADGTRLLDLIYELSWLSNGRGFALSCPIGRDLEPLRIAILVLGVFQALLLIGSARKGARAIRRTLQPLHAMLDEAKLLSEKASEPAPPRTLDIAGALGGIDELDLNRRLSPEDTPEELRPLAVAINEMLDRISAAYEIQKRFVSDASHELRTPIAVIQGYANLLDRWGAEDADTLRESIAAIQTEAVGMQTMVEQLLFLARGDNRSLPLAEEEISLKPFLEEFSSELSLVYAEHPLCVACPDDLVIWADCTLLRQLLRIFADNGAKYSSGGSGLFLRAQAVGANQIDLSVSDNGRGIREADLPHIFDRFYRSDEARADAAGGAGLGLSIARVILARHGWRVSVQSREGLGTKFTIHIAERI